MYKDKSEMTTGWVARSTLENNGLLFPSAALNNEIILLALAILQLQNYIILCTAESLSSNTQ
jgi:hypothetical protein